MSGYRTHDYAKRKEANICYSWFGPDYQFMVQQRERRLLALLRRHNYEDLKSKKILELQHRTVHKLRNLKRHVPRRALEAMKSEHHKITYADAV